MTVEASELPFPIMDSTYIDPTDTIGSRRAWLVAAIVHQEVRSFIAASDRAVASTCRNSVDLPHETRDIDISPLDRTSPDKPVVCHGRSREERSMSRRAHTYRRTG